MATVGLVRVGCGRFAPRHSQQIQQPVSKLDNVIQILAGSQHVQARGGQVGQQRQPGEAIILVMGDGPLYGRLPKIKQQLGCGAGGGGAGRSLQWQVTAVLGQFQPKVGKAILLNEFTRQGNGRLPQIARQQPAAQPDRLNLPPKCPMFRLPIGPGLLVDGVTALESEQEVGQGTAT